MMEKIDPLSLDGIKTYSIKERHSKVSHRAFAQAWSNGGGFRDFLDRLPDILAGRTFKKVVAAWVQARQQGRLVILGMGAHPIKVGLNPILIDLMRRGLLSALAMNGAGIIHDAELAMAGMTSEDVDQDLACGRFGMAQETGKFLNDAIAGGAAQGLGLGEAVARRLQESSFPFKHLSLLCAAAELDIPVTVHVAVGTDIIHLHSSVDPEAGG